MIAYLARTYDERPIAAGLRSDGRVLEVLASKTGETWSVLISTANGIACLAASGEAWLPMTSELALQSADPGA